MTTYTHGSGPGFATPENGDGLTTPHSQPAKSTSKNSDGILTGNSIAHLSAMFALKGHTVIRGDRSDFIVTKYGLTRYCANSAELATFAQIVGAI